MLTAGRRRLHYLARNRPAAVASASWRHIDKPKEHAMTLARPTPFLRWALLADAIATGGTGLLMTLAAGALAPLLQLPEPLLFYAGLPLIPYAIFVGWLARRDVMPRFAVWAVIVLNVLWAADCALLAFSGWVAPTALGYAFILMQVVVVAAFAELQYVGLRRSTISA
jgi:hypothetical protein